MSNTSGQCSPRCEFFRCGQRALVYQKNRVYCRGADDDCAGPVCNYALCLRGRMLSNGVCGLSVRRKTREETGSEAFEEPQIRLRGKIRRRFREEDIL